MVSNTRRLRRAVRPRAAIDAAQAAPWFHHLSLAAVLVAALVAGVAVLFQSNSDASQRLVITVALPGLGSGAPATLSELRAGTDAVPGISQTETLLVTTARRYATHLVGDIVEAPRVAAGPLQTAEEVQIALSVARTLSLVRTEAASLDPVTSDTVLQARLGLAPGEALPPYFTYDVQRGDTVEKIARRFNITTESILINNWEIRDPNLLEPGAQVTVPTRDGVVYTVRLGDTLFALAENYAAEVEDILAFPGNSLDSPDRLVEGSTILLVGGGASEGGFGATGSVFAIPDFRWPVGGILTDFFGAGRGNSVGFHTGIDLSAPTGTFIGAAAPGIAIQAGWDGSFGNSVLVDHGGGVITRYAHMSHIDVFLGEFVEPGDLIGFLGSTGYSTGSHLHFEIIMGGVPVDPLVWLNS